MKYKILWLGKHSGAVAYGTAELAWRAVHELLEEAFGDSYGEKEIAEYEVVAA